MDKKFMACLLFGVLVLSTFAIVSATNSNKVFTSIRATEGKISNILLFKNFTYEKSKVSLNLRAEDFDEYGNANNLKGSVGGSILAITPEGNRMTLNFKGDATDFTDEEIYRLYQFKGTVTFKTRDYGLFAEHFNSFGAIDTNNFKPTRYDLRLIAIENKDTGQFYVYGESPGFGRLFFVDSFKLNKLR